MEKIPVRCTHCHRETTVPATQLNQKCPECGDGILKAIAPTSKPAPTQKKKPDYAD